MNRYSITLIKSLAAINNKLTVDNKRSKDSTTRNYAKNIDSLYTYEYIELNIMNYYNKLYMKFSNSKSSKTILMIII